ncbi:MAG: DUF3810 domain-containing protein [Clostridia bacterium]|nr:DUF3810 domain-containing protein [Clostridia bacterium]
MKAIGRVILSAIFLVLTGLMAAFANYAPQLVFQFYPKWSRDILSRISSVTELLPIALWEVLLVLIVLWVLYTFVRIFSGKTGFLKWLTGLLLGASVGLFLFVGLWGLNHFGPGVGENLGLSVRPYSKDELIAATRYYARQAGSLADSVSRDEEGRAEFDDFSVLAKQAGDGYAVLAKRDEQFTGSLSPVKPLASGKLFSLMGNTGIFICFTAESCVNPDTYEAWIPFTMCHEIAHRQAVAAEDDANFCAYLACMENDSKEFQYSGAFAAFIYCNNALAEVDSKAASEMWSETAPGVLKDALAANEHYSQYEGKVQDVAQKVNDAYLKAFSEESGVQSYGEVADLLIAWYLQKQG